MLLYCNSMDHYGTGVAPAYDNGDTDMGWDFSKETTGLSFIGDRFLASPTIGSNNRAQPIGSYGIGTPPWGARRGDFALYSSGVNIERFTVSGATYVVSGQESLRMAIPGPSLDERIIHFAFSIDDLPELEFNHGMIVSLQDSFGQVRGYIGVNPSGRLVLYAGNTWSSGSSGDITSEPTVLAVTSSPVILPETWYSINVKITTSVASVGEANVQIYMGDISPANLVMDTTASALTPTGFEQIDVLGWLPASMAGDVGVSVDTPSTRTLWIRDIVVCDNTGVYNNDHLGQVFVAAQEMRAEVDEGDNWSKFTRENIGSGILDMRTRGGMRVSDNANLNIGASSYTIEGFWRFDSIPTTDEYVLASQWSDTDSQRGWKLSYDSTTDTFRFMVSTDGIAETTLLDYPFEIEQQKWYHIAVTRDVVSGVGTWRFFLNGTQLGVDKVDSATYHNSTTAFGIGCHMTTGTTIDTSSAFDGWLDEFRFTNGLARYTSDFVPTTALFGRNSVDDPDFTSVELLLGFDGSITDESDNAFTVTAGTGVVVDVPDDDGPSYVVLNARPGLDDTYIEARNTFAENILTLTANPTATETVTLGARTYTFVTVFSSNPIDEVLIGADTENTLLNLIAAVNGEAGEGTLYGTGTTTNLTVYGTVLPDPQALFQSATVGTGGNSVVTTETLANGSFRNGATMTQGTDLPGPSDFRMERLPIDATGVLGMQVTARGYKSTAGSADIRFDLVGPATAVDVGTVVSADLNPAWLYQIFEEDPDTSASITPSTITGGRVRVNRTA